MIKQREKLDKPRSTSQYVNARNGKVIHSDILLIPTWTLKAQNEAWAEF